MLSVKLEVLIEDMEREYNQPVNLPDPDKNQCHICTRFETENNPLFAYTVRDNGDFIWRCQKGHAHDHGMVYLNIFTGLEVCC